MELKQNVNKRRKKQVQMNLEEQYNAIKRSPFLSSQHFLHENYFKLQEVGSSNLERERERDDDEEAHFMRHVQPNPTKEATDKDSTVHHYYT